jgi:Na+/proline symporter
MASHGTDQLIVQRLLTCKDLAASRKALIGSGFAVIVQFLVFLLLGLGLWVFYEARTFERSDEIFALFIVEELPAGLTGLLIAGVFAAAMSSLSSSINALASASAYDFWAPKAGAEGDEERILRAGKGFTLLWSGLLVGGAIVFIPLSRGSAAVEVALAIASLVYGGLLGAFALGAFRTRADAFSVRVGMVVGIATVTALWIFARSAVAWPWYVPIGSAITFGAGALLGRGNGEGLEVSGDEAGPA